MLSSISIDAQSCQQSYLLDWDDYNSDLQDGYIEGSTSFFITENDGNFSDTYVYVNTIGDTEVLVKKRDSPANLSMPVVNEDFYGNRPALIIAGTLAEMTKGESITTTFDFGVAMKQLRFELYDVDANTANDQGSDRQEGVIIWGETLDGVRFYPTINSGLTNTLSGDTIIGIGASNADANHGNVQVDFYTQPISKVYIQFVMYSSEDNPTGGEPSFGIGNIHYCLLEGLSIERAELEVVKLSNTEVAVQWQYQNGFNYDRFDFERTLDGQTWTHIQTTEALQMAGNHKYEFVDAVAGLKGLLSYRVRVLYPEGHIAYSEIKSVEINPDTSIKIYPTLTESLVYIEGVEQADQIEVFDLLGRNCSQMIHVIFESDFRRNLDLSSLPNQVYFVRIGDYTKRIVLQR